MVEFSDLLGKTIVSIDVGYGKEEMVVTLDNRIKYRMYHDQNSCEVVSIEDICGDLRDLLDSPILLAEEVSHENTNPPDVSPPEYQDSYTWTFYKLATVQGAVTLRWYGASNGDYSERVDFERVTE